MGAHLRADVFRPSDDDRQDVVKIMRDRAGKLPQRLHLLRLQEIPLRAKPPFVFFASALLAFHNSAVLALTLNSRL